MDVIKSRRMFSLVTSVALVTSLAIGAYAAPVAAKPDEQQVAAKEARAQARAEAKAARDAAKQARAQARAEAKAAREAAKQARADARAARKAERQAAREKVDVCHKPGTPAEGTLSIAGAALQAHLDHGDVEGACPTLAEAALSTCSDVDGSDVDEEGAACEEPQEQELVVSIDAPETVASAEPLTLQGAVSGLEVEDPTYSWSSTCLADEQLTDPTVIASEPGSALLVIQADVLTPETTCEFTLTVADEDAGAEGSATVTVEVLAVPS